MPGLRARLRAVCSGAPDIVHGKVDTDAQRELAATAVLEDLIAQIKTLDMAKVRARIAERKAASKA